MAERYPFPDLNTLPEDIRARILEVQEKAGFIPNVFLAFARRPAEWRRVRARGMAQDFGWARAAADYLALYRGLMPM